MDQLWGRPTRRCRVTLLWTCLASGLFIVFQLVFQLWLERMEDHIPVVHHLMNEKYSLQDVDDITLVWWTPFTGNPGSVLRCGLIHCFITQDRQFQFHPGFMMFLFYGSNIDILDLPLPRKHYDLWSLLHEESPKNVPFLSHEEGISLFNYTSTFSRFSDVPLTLQYVSNLESITDLRYFVPLQVKNELLKDLSPILYIQSDCSTPLDRDNYVKRLMEFVPVDSYGTCLQNKKLPNSMVDAMESLTSEEFLHFVARYKFTLSFENAACDDYITEKLWRPLAVGSVPIYWGSPSVQDWLPNPNSAILASNFSSPKELASHILELNENDKKYISYLSHKKGIIQNQNFLSKMKSRVWGFPEDSDYHYIDHFECQMCLQAHSNANGNLKSKVASRKEYFCPRPKSSITFKEDPSNMWLHVWDYSKCEASVLQKYVEEGHTFVNETLFGAEVESKFREGQC